MNTKDLARLGVPAGEPLALAHEFIQSFIAQGNDGALLEAEVFNIVANSPEFFADELRAPWRQWGEGLEAEAVKQMANACARPSAASSCSPRASMRCRVSIRTSTPSWPRRPIWSKSSASSIRSS